MPYLVPVDDDPFSINLMPVEGDPFSQGPIAKAGQTIQSPDIRSDLATMPAKVAGVAGDMTGITDAVRALRGQMTPDEAQMFALGAVPMLIAPEAKAAGALAEEAAPAIAKGIRAFHGSPYDFDRFDLSQIGTGEGAQAYGHGLYFAERPETAEAYKKALTGLNPNQLGSGKAEYGINGIPMPSGIAGHAALDTGQEMSLLLGVMKDNPNSTMIPFLKQQIENRIANHYSMQSEGAAGDDMRAMAQYYNEHIKNAKPEDVSHIAPGKVYEVNINANPEHFLDWDKPLSEQPQVVEKIKASPQYQQMAAANHFGYSPQEFAQLPIDRQQKLISETSPKTHDAILWEARPGHGLLASFEGSFGGSDKATKALRNAGIPGIKYLDQGSRSAGTGTSNYVVFDDKLIDIVKKYGLAGLISGGAAHFSTEPVDHDPFAQ